MPGPKSNVPIRRGNPAARGVLLVLTGLGVAAAPSAAAGQRPDATPERVAARPDTLPPLVDWGPPDSVMRALLEREGYRATRYQGEEIIVEPGERVVRLRGEPAALRRDSTTILADTIRYDAESGVARARGERVVVRDPARSPAELVARRELAYDLDAHEARLGAATFAVAGPTTWFVHAGRAVLTDLGPGRGPATLYATHGWLTSCENEPPHYHLTVRTVKVVAGRLLVARSAVVHIGGVPVFWLPFFVQDLRPGRGTGFLMPRIGFSDAFSGGTTRQPHVENVGVRFAIGTAFDGRVSLDWRRGAGDDSAGRGWIRYNAGARYGSPSYRVAGQMAVAHLRAGAATNTSLAWDHEQRFAPRHRLLATANLASDPALRRATSFHPYQALAVLRSAASYTRQLGDVSVALGASRRAYPGGASRVAELPIASIAAAPIALGPRVAWTPSFWMTAGWVTGDTVAGAAPVDAAAPGSATSPAAPRVRSTIATFDSPLTVLGATWRNAGSVAHHDLRPDHGGGQAGDTRERFTLIDWQTEVRLPTFAPRRWNVTPAISLANVDPAPWLVRSDRGGTGRFVRQPKRLQLGAIAAPTFRALLPGIGRFARLRHSVTPIVEYAFAPRARVGDAYLAAIGRSREDYLGELARNRLSVALAMSLEGETEARADTTAGGDAGSKVKLLSLTLDALAYDFERARRTGRTGLVTESVGMVVRSDLLAGFDLGARFGVLDGSPLSDTARVRPRLRELRVGFSLGGIIDPFGSIERAFGRAIPLAEADSAVSPFAEGTGGDAASDTVAMTGGGTRPWYAAFAFTAVRPPPLAPAGLRLLTEAGLPTFATRVGRLTALQLRTGARRGRWAADVLTVVDMRESRLAGHMITVQRDLHDWRVAVGHVRAPNGNSAFTVSLRLRQKPPLAPTALRGTIRTIDAQR